MKRQSAGIKFVGVLIAAFVFGLVLMVDGSDTSAAQQSNFMGGNPSVENSDDQRLLRLRFPAGVRSNWHTHTDGQLLMLEEGLGLTQVRGEAIYEMHPGEPWWTGSGVEHWHGASDLEGTRVIQQGLSIDGGTGVYWLEEVTEDDYMGNDIGINSRTRFLETGVR